MCGIAGIISPNQSLVTGAALERMSRCLSHRGPDASGVWISDDKQAGFAHRRLAILDLTASGNQPQHLEDRFTIVHNGEIYNYIELRSALQNKGYRFHTSTDTEVILAAYACFGTDCLAHFDGMFAFAIWDNVAKKVFMARDRLGEKPLFYYYSKENAELKFASGLNALHASGVAKTINHRLLLQFLGVGHTTLVTEPAATFYSNIFQVRPAHYMIFDLQENLLTEELYWNCAKEVTNAGEQQAATEIRRLLKDSVDRRMRSDVPVGTSLSGGLDSNSIAALIQQVRPGNYKSFSAVFPGYKKDESALTSLASSRYGIGNFVTSPSALELASELESFLSAHEIPVATPTAFAQYKVFQLARQHDVKVLLDGQGADELLAGYTKYHHWFLQELISRGNWAEFKKQYKELKNSNRSLHIGPANFMAAWFPFQAANALERKERRTIKAHRLLNDAYVEEYYHKDDTYKAPVLELNDILYFNTFQSGLGELLTYADRNSMAHGCEVRLPFLFDKLVSYSFSLPSSLKMNNGYGKYVLRKAMSGIIPDEICWNRNKIGFDVPIEEWITDSQIRQQLEESVKTLEKAGILKAGFLNNKKPQFDAAAQWRILVVGKWING